MTCPEGDILVFASPAVPRPPAMSSTLQGRRARGSAAIKALGFFALGLAFATPALAFQSDAEVRQRIIRESIAAYPGPCPCPYSVMRNGRSCGGRSAYSRPGGYAPICYPRDVDNTQVSEWRRARR